MMEEPDLRFDIDALFEHTTNNLGQEEDEVQDWCFSLRAPDLKVLEIVASELENDFHVELQERVEEIDVDGTVTHGDPMLTVVERGALTADQVKKIANQLSELAKARDLIYEGVDSYEAIDEEELFGWLPPDEAGWRLRHLTDAGLEDDAELPWAFLVLTSNVETTTKIVEELKQNKFSDFEKYDEPDEDGEFGVCIFVTGKNNEIELEAMSEEISKIAVNHNGRLEGIQFYTREEMEEVFGEDDEDE